MIKKQFRKKIIPIYIKYGKNGIIKTSKKKKTPKNIYVNYVTIVRHALPITIDIFTATNIKNLLKKLIPN